VKHLSEVDIQPLPSERFASVLTPEGYDEFTRMIEAAQKLFEGRVVWTVNSTARGGGVAEMLMSLIARAKGAGIDARWLVIEGQPDFFAVTKRIHNHLHGSRGSGERLDEEERRVYEAGLAKSAAELSSIVGERDVVILHDPQTAGLTEAVAGAAAAVIWRCHVGIDVPNDLARNAWRFLSGYIEPADAYVFSREAFEWEGLDRGKMHVIPPSIEAFSPKNQDLSSDAVAAILHAAHAVEGEAAGDPTFELVDGTPERVRRAISYYDGGPPPPQDARLVVQVSRWDRLKDPVGVIRGFAAHIEDPDVHLIVAGPAVEAVSDDPEGRDVLEESRASWDELDEQARRRIHLACIPMDDGDENAAIVNALQRRADVVVQKSLAEGFGLTVAEAMWKGRPVVASKIGGIQDQIIDGKTGVLIADPTDLDEYGAALDRVLQDPEGAARMGREAKKRVRDEFLGPRHLTQYFKLIASLLS
jgi:trehalose synthase